MTPKELEAVAEKLVQNNPPWFCTIEQDTQPELLAKSRKTGEKRPFVQVRHLSRKLVILGGRYQSQVNRQRQREDKPPDFIASELWEGQGYHVPNSPCLVRHKEHGEQDYTAYRIQKNLEDMYVITYPNGLQDLVDKSVVQDYLKDGNRTEKQGLEKPIHWRTVKVENVVKIGYGGA